MKKQEYVKQDAVAHIMAKMARWNITIQDLVDEYKRIMTSRVVKVIDGEIKRLKRKRKR